MLLYTVQVRLVDGTSKCSGRVEVLYKGQWGTVCDDNWRLKEGNIVCRQLGCGQAIFAPGYAYFGSGSGPVWLDDVDCNGNESSILDCRHNSVGDNNCRRGEDASVICLSRCSLLLICSEF